jgi:N-methylhydantoinase B
MLMRVDPIEYQIILDQIGSIASEMQELLFRTGYSTIVRESQDGSCGITTATGEVIGQHVVLPLHLGAFGACVDGVLQTVKAEDMAAGEVYVVNDCYVAGNPHTPDVAVIAPVVWQGSVRAFVITIAHKSDIGGLVRGSTSASAREIFHEGLLLPPVRLTDEVARIVASNSREPELVLGDLFGQAGVCRTGARRMSDLLERWGSQVLDEVTDEAFRRTEQVVRNAVGSWPDGKVTASANLEHDGTASGGPVEISVTIDKRGESIVFDFTASGEATPGPLNLRPPLVKACCTYAMAALIGPTIPVNTGLFRSFDVLTRPGSILNPLRPAAVGSYMKTAQLVVEVLLRAFDHLLPGLGMAESGGSSGIAVEWQETQSALQYEVVGTAMGARPTRDGVSAVDVHLGNCRCTPIEMLEHEFPVRVERFELIPDSGGAGRWRGGLASVRSYRALAPGTVIFRVDKALPAAGTAGGAPGTQRTLAILPPNRPPQVHTRAGEYRVEAGDVFELRNSSGGGYGHPLDRPIEMVVADVHAGYVSPAAALDVYGVVQPALGVGVPGETERRLDRKRTSAVKQSSGDAKVAVDGGSRG